MDVSRRWVFRLSTASAGALALGACTPPHSGEYTYPAPSDTTPSPPTTPSQSTSPSPTPTPTPTPETEVWEDVEGISHLFFHSLIAEPQRAFDGDSRAAGYLNYMITVDEFTAILDQLYERDYVLVSPHEMFGVDEDAAVSRAELEVPAGKTPLVISVDDVSYYSYMDGDGFASNLKVTDGRVRNTYVDAGGTEHTGSYDVVPLLDDFIAEHPDFSPFGAKGVIAMTGYDGVFGYRTSPTANDDNDHLDQSRRAAKEVAEALREDSWEFACHTWGHINCAEEPMSSIRFDMDRWKDEVEPLVGETNLLVYPYGADIAGVEHYSGPKFEYFKSQGFDAYFHVDGSTPAWVQFGDTYMRQARINVDGISLKAVIEGRHHVLQEFFDPESVLDPLRPESISGRAG